MEDRNIFMDDFDTEEKKGLFVVIDGHGGEVACEWVERHFVEVFKEELASNNRDKERVFKDTFAKLEESLEKRNDLGSG